VSVADGIATVLVVCVLAVPVWRWPVQTLIACFGLAVSAVVWTAVGPWAGWTALAVTAGVVAAWSMAGGNERVAKPALRSLLASPSGCGWVVFVGSIGLVMWAPTNRLAVTGLVMAAGAAGWLVWPLLHPAPAPARGVERRSVPVRERARHRVVSGPCPDCGGTLVASVRVADSPAAPGVRGRARCEGCGCRFVAVVDDEAGGVVWVELARSTAVSDDDRWTA
jgi:hypothetical protein